MKLTNCLDSILYEEPVNREFIAFLVSNFPNSESCLMCNESPEAMTYMQYIDKIFEEATKAYRNKCVEEAAYLRKEDKSLKEVNNDSERGHS